MLGTSCVHGLQAVSTLVLKVGWCTVLLCTVHFAVLGAPTFTCDNPTATSLRVVGNAALPQNTGMRCEYACMETQCKHTQKDCLYRDLLANIEAPLLLAAKPYLWCVCVCVCVCVDTVSAAGLLVIFGEAEASAVASSLSRGTTQACVYRATLSGPQNTLQATYRVQIDSRTSALYSGEFATQS